MAKDQRQTRIDTNSSLDAERTAADDVMSETARIERRVLDDLIERDRIRAEERLLRLRARADKLLASERLASPALDKAMERERLLADEIKQAERNVTDAAREHEHCGSGSDENAGEDPQNVTSARRWRVETDSRLEKERRSADALLDDTSAELDRAKMERPHRRDVLAKVAHDLRSPLTVIAMSAHFLLEDSQESTTREVAQDMERSAARMERLLTDLLEVAHIESGVFQVVKEEHDVGELVREVYRTYRPMFADRQLTFSADEPPSTGLASFDHDRIVQVISNLLANAMKFTPPEGSVRLLGRVRPDHIDIEVFNSGPGVPSEALSHVFDRFWQNDEHAGRGLGLGLYICREIVEAHGGRIEAESVLGEGTTFRFTLPLQ